MNTAPYPPSWQNRFFESLARGPVPAWVKSILLFLVFTALNHLIPWAEGTLAWGKFDPSQLTFQVWFLVVFLAGDYFLVYSREALRRFRPAYGGDDAEFEALGYRFTHLSARVGWAATVASLPFAVASLSLGTAYQQSGWAAASLVGTGTFMFSLVFFFILYLVRITVMVQRVYRQVDGVDLFHLEPLHAFAGLTSRVGVFCVLAGSLSYFTDIALAENPTVGVFAFFFGLNVVLGLMAFILPLREVHNRLREEKERISAENDRRIEVAFRQLHARFDRGEREGMTEFRHALSALLDFRSVIRAISTWPWEPGTLRGFLSAMLLPVALFLLQRFLSNLLAL